MNVSTRVGFALFGAIMGYAAYTVSHTDKPSQTNALASAAIGGAAGYFVGKWFTT